MVILSIHNSADIYGASRCLVRMLRLFVRNGHRVHVAIPCSGPLEELLQECGVRIHILPALAIIERSQFHSLGGKIAFIYRFLASTTQLSGLIVHNGVDVVHINTAVLPTGALAARLTGRRSVWHQREFFAEFPSLWRFYKYYVWLLSSHIITISHAVGEQFPRFLRVKCTTIYDGLDEDAMKSDEEAVRSFRARVGNPTFLVGLVGRIKYLRKGQEVLVEAAAILRDRFPDLRYLIVGTVAPGNEDHLRRLRDLIHTNGLDSFFFFSGDVRDARNVYAAVDITVVPSVQPEPFGCVVMESMALGTPVIASRCGGIPEQIVDMETGLLFKPGSASELAGAISLLIQNSALRKRMGQAGQERFRKTFRMKETYEQLCLCFEVARNG